MSKDLMNYSLLAQDALRGVVRLALDRVQQEGLPGKHYFYIAFKTTAPGVEVSDALRAQYPADMTIIIQHQYSDLEVDAEKFAVTLFFNKMPERLVVPYTALLSFYDPSVMFALKFGGDEEDLQTDDDGADGSDGDIAEVTALSSLTAEDKPSPEKDPEASADVVSLDRFRSSRKK